MEDLPAPFGPMIARTSPSRMSKEMSAIAVTPPKRSVMWRISMSTPPMVRPSGVTVSFTPPGPPG